MKMGRIEKELERILITCNICGTNETVYPYGIHDDSKFNMVSNDNILPTS